MRDNFRAGVYESGRKVAWSKSWTVENAAKMARKFAKRLRESGPRTGDALAWTAWYETTNGIVDAEDCNDDQ